MNIELKRPIDLTGAETSAWRAFQAADPALHSPYFAVEFAQACGLARPDTQIAVIRKNGAIKGFWPFHRAPFGYAHPLGGPLSDFHGVVAAEDIAADLPVIMRAANICVYPFHFAPQSQSCFSSCADRAVETHSADLSNGFDVWYGDRLLQHKKSLKRYEAKARQLEKQRGPLVFTLNERNPAAFETLLRWKSAQYRETGTFDVFSVAWTNTLLRALWQTQSAGFCGQLSTLRAGDTLVAAHFGISGQHGAHYWFPAYDPAYARFGVGNALLLALIRSHAQAGVETLDLGVGDFRYKHQFGGQSRTLIAGTALSPSLGAFCRQGALMVQNGFEALPMGKISNLPRRLLSRLDREMAFRLV